MKFIDTSGRKSYGSAERLGLISAHRARLMKRYAHCVFLSILGIFSWLPPAAGYSIAQFNGTTTSGWTDGPIAMQMQLGDTGGASLIDGNTEWGLPAENALAIWNEILGRTQFTVVRNSTIPRVSGDGKNSVFFDSKIFGASFGSGVVAVTVIKTAGANQHIVEADVIFNNQAPYNSYRGPLRTASVGGTLSDMRRVALREFGRVLGLNYPDTANPPQQVAAQMNFVPSDLDTLAQDDVDGAQKLYGPPALLARLGNISTRLIVQRGDNVLIAGFIVQGPAAKKVVVRAIGPSLGAVGVPNPLADPTLALFDGNGTPLFSNDNWQDIQAAEIEDTGIAPADPLESAIIATLNPGNYTAIVRGANDGVGVGLVEVYDLTDPSSTDLANISSRGRVETGDNAMIGGFIVQGESAQRVIVRAIGPSLAAFNVPDVLADPVLELHDAAGQLIATNDDWGSTQRAEIAQTLLQPNDDRESAIVATLNPGNYTAVVRGKNNATGVSLIEVYRLSQTTLPITMSISTNSVAVAPNGTQAFGIGIAGTSNSNIVWSVNGIVGGNSVVGTISSTGVYHAPAIPPPGPVTITARSAADPGIAASAIIAVGTGITAPSIYEGTYIGQFNAKYHYDYLSSQTGQIVRVDGSRSFNMTIELKTIVAAINGTDTLTVNKATCSDPFFAAQGSVVALAPSVATLPNPIQNVSTQSGQGIQIFFPNGTTLGTWNDVGALHVSSDGRLLSNSLDPSIATFTWLTAGGGGKDYFSVSVPDAAAHGTTVIPDKLTWAFTKSSF
jgi:hypothetical protein